MEPKLSIIVPVYNVENYLSRCLDSIIDQSYRNLQIILINDGSADASGAICDTYASKDHRIEVVHQKNQGNSAARNAGLERVKGEYITFVDSDDWIHEDMYRILLDNILKSGSSLILCNYKNCSSFTDLENPINIEDTRTLDSEKTLELLLNEGFYVWRLLFSNKQWGHLRFKGIVCEDVMYYADILESMQEALFINIPLYAYYIGNQTSLTRSDYNFKKMSNLDANIYLEKKCGKILGMNPKLAEVIRKNIVNNCLWHFKHLDIIQKQNLDTDRSFVKKAKKIYNFYHNLKRDSSLLQILVRITPTLFLPRLFQLRKASNRL